MKPQTEWDISAQTVTEKDISYNEDYRCMFLHINAKEMPERCLKDAAEHTVQLFNFWQTVHKIFRMKGKGKYDVFMIQLESFVPGDDKDKRSQVSPGLLFCFTFPESEFNAYFHVAGVAAIALARGFLAPHELYVKNQDWDALEKSIEQFDPVDGCSTTTKIKLKKPKLPTEMLPPLTTEALDMAIKQYHLHEFQWDKDTHKNSEEDWEMRASMFSSSGLFQRSPRMRAVYDNLLGYARWKSENSIIMNMKGEFKNLKEAVNQLNEKGVYDDVLQRHLNLYQWDGSVKKGYNLDLKDYIAWHMIDDHFSVRDGFFLENRFYERLIDKKLIMRGSGKKRGNNETNSGPPTKMQKLKQLALGSTKSARSLETM